MFNFTIFKLGISSHFGLYNLPFNLEEYMVNCPMFHLNVVTGFSTEMMELLMQGEIDVAIVKDSYFSPFRLYRQTPEKSVCLQFF